MFNLKKQHTPSPHSKLIQELNDNARITENALNELNRADERHQQSESAHKAEHITHRGKSVSHWLNSLWSRLINLIVNHDGNDIKEVIDGRVALDATIHPTLNDRLEYDFDQVYKRFDFCLI